MTKLGGNSFMHNASMKDARMFIERDPLCWWYSGDRGTRRRKEPIRAIVLHHTAGEGNGHRIFKTLTQRALSVHFTIDYDGHVMQHVDTSTVAFHAGLANEWSIGVEIQNYGVPNPARVSEKFPRPIYEDVMHGRKMKFLAFTDAQCKATQNLCLSLSEQLGIPYKFLVNDEGRAHRHEVSGERLKTVAGIIGHFNVARRKVDPSPHLLDYLIRGGKG